MSVLPSSESYLASALRNGPANHESFQKFYQYWISEQDRHLQDLISAASTAEDNQQQQQETLLCPLINRVIRHYEDYYRAKSHWIQRDVTSMLTPSWRSTLEDAFLWIGGWRPTMAFHLLYSKSGLQMETHQLDELIRGIGGGETDLGGLSPSQLVEADELQRRTVREEREVTEKMAEVQESLADSTMVELTHLVSESQRMSGSDGVGSKRVESTLEEKREGLAEVMEWADDLRLRTLKAVIGLLKPIQAVHFLIAAAELHLRIHEWGEKRDADHHQQQQQQQGQHLHGGGPQQ